MRCGPVSVSSSNLYVEILTPKMIVLEIKFFGGSDEVLEVEALRDGTRALTEGTPEGALLTAVSQEHGKDRKNQTTTKQVKISL